MQAKLSIYFCRWLLTAWNSLRFGTMILLAFISLRKDCPVPSFVQQQEYEASSAINVTADIPNVWRSSTYPIAATSLFLWTGVLQALMCCNLCHSKVGYCYFFYVTQLLYPLFLFVVFILYFISDSALMIFSSLQCLSLSLP